MKQKSVRAWMHRRWECMIARCCKPKSALYPRYGARGIGVCDRWKSFEAFYADMGDPPFAGASLERKNNKAGYCPENVVWASPKEQARNRGSNLVIHARGKSQCAAAWAEELGIRVGTIVERVRAGCSGEEALRPPAASLRYEFKGESKTLWEWSKAVGLRYHLIWQRIVKRGWTVERALTIRDGRRKYAVGC